MNELGGLTQGGAWSRDEGYRPVRAKYYLPNEPSAFEAVWFDRGDPSFAPIEMHGEMRGLRVGAQLCSELFFNERAREVGRAGGHLLVGARASGGHPRWLPAVRMAAIVSGCFTVSANRRSSDTTAFGGTGWIVAPDGDVLATTTAEAPFATASINVAVAQAAQATYPRSIEA